MCVVDRPAIWEGGPSLPFHPILPHPHIPTGRRAANTLYQTHQPRAAAAAAAHARRDAAGNAAHLAAARRAAQKENIDTTAYVRISVQ